MNKKILSALKVSSLAIILSFGIGYALAWTAPTTTPPGGNVSAPINTGSTDQTKAGDFCTSKGGITKCLSNAQLSGPGITFTAIPATIQNGQTSTLDWAVTGAASCTASGDWTGAKDPSSGTFTTSSLLGPLTYTYTLSCVSGGGVQTSQTVQVQVLSTFSAIYSNGTGNWVTVPSGVTSIKFKALGSNGVSGGINMGSAGAGGGASFAYYGAKIPIVVVGGGGGGSVGGNASIRAGGFGGYTGSNIHGAGGAGSVYIGSAGNITTGGAGGNAGTKTGGGGGANSTRSDGGIGAYGGGTGGRGLTNNSIGGAPSGSGSWGAGGGGGGLAGGGGGADGGTGEFDPNGGGGGGGGSGYLISGTSAPDANGFVTVPVSAMGGNPGSIYIYGGSGGSSGSITMTW